MKPWKTVPLAVIGTLMTVTATYLAVTSPDTRSVSFVDAPVPQVADRLQSAGLFVGVSQFAHDDMLTVPFAVDDAVDLAHRFSLDQRSSLVPPRHVVLALSGPPRKEDSKRRLQELKEAGAEVQKATSGDIQQLLQKQVAVSGKNGLLVLTLATHGFLDDRGDAYILGSTSEIGSTETSLATARLLDIAGRATRSLVLIDACRNRADASMRSGVPDRRTVAPLLARMKSLRGQVVFYAAAADQVAYDDPVTQNGVFTKAVLDGLDCKAATPHRFVIAGTLNTYVERTVREWIRKNKNIDAAPATQFSKEGSAHSMALAECWRHPKFPIRPEIDGRWITAYDETPKRLWRKELNAAIVSAQTADLDADAFHEVVAATAERITAFNRDGGVVWQADGDGLRLATFTTGDLKKKHTNQVVAIWTGEHSSRLTVMDDRGREQSSDDYPGLLQHVIVLRPTNKHNPIIVAASADRLFAIDAKKLSTKWSLLLTSPGDSIRGLQIQDRDSKWRDIAVKTKKGINLFDFEGASRSANADWIEVKSSRRR